MPHHILPSRRQPHATQEKVQVHDNVEPCVTEKRENLQRLRELQPEEAHDDHHDMPEDMADSGGALLEDMDESAEEFIVFSDVKDVRPEEDASCRPSTHGKAKDPLPDSFGSPP